MAEEEVAFRELLAKRNIQPDRLLEKQPETYRRWLQLFSQTHPESFLLLVRQEINQVRRQVQGLPAEKHPEGGRSSGT